MAAGGEQEENYSEQLGSEDLTEVVCDPCQEDGELYKAVGMCVDCQDYLCRRCFDVHKVARAYRKHELQDKEQMQQSQIIQQRKDQCTEQCAVHEDGVIKYYCRNHSHLGCSDCITLDHRLCDKVTYIPHAANDLVNNEEYQQVESQLKSVVERWRKLNDNHKKTTESLEKGCSEAVRMIQDYRRELNKTLDMVEADLIQKCKTMKKEEIKKNAQIIDKCKTTQSDLHALMTKVETYQKNKQNCNLYTAMMKTKDKIRSIEGRVHKAENAQLSMNGHTTFVTNKDILSTLKHVEVLGRLALSGASSVLRPAKSRTSLVHPEETATAKQEEIRTIVRAEYVQDIGMRSKSDSKTCFVSGMVALSDGRIVIADFSNGITGNGNVKLVDIKRDEVITHLALFSVPWDVAKIHNGQVVVTLPDSKKIASVNVAASVMTVDSMFDVDGKCRGVDYMDGQLAVSFVSPHKVQVLTLKGRVLHTIKTDTLGKSLLNGSYYVVFGEDTNSLFVSDFRSNNVVHVKIDGTVVGTYTDGELSRPEGLLTDSSGNVYVCERDSNNIHQITPDCRKIQVLLTGADGLSQPLSISYSEAESRVYVGMYNNNVIKMYKVTLGTK